MRLKKNIQDNPVYTLILLRILIKTTPTWHLIPKGLPSGLSSPQLKEYLESLEKLYNPKTSKERSRNAYTFFIKQIMAKTDPQLVKNSEYKDGNVPYYECNAIAVANHIITTLNQKEKKISFCETDEKIHKFIFDEFQHYCSYVCEFASDETKKYSQELLNEIKPLYDSFSGTLNGYTFNKICQSFIEHIGYQYDQFLTLKENHKRTTLSNFFYPYKETYCSTRFLSECRNYFANIHFPFSLKIPNKKKIINQHFQRFVEKK
ncbi:MAG: hypothetical protein Q7S92_05885 [Candidatus Diapherotrites archaeon]|nr:hypothetical protein [Candidatus Diapherotrites archaeon]